MGTWNFFEWKIPTPYIFILYSLRAGLHFDKICRWLLLSFIETYKTSKGDLIMMRLDTLASGPLVHEWAKLSLAIKQNQHFLSHSQCQWTVLCHWQGLSFLLTLWWAQSPIDSQSIKQNSKNRAFNGALALGKTKQKKTVCVMWLTVIICDDVIPCPALFNLVPVL